MRDFSDDLAELRRRVEGARGYLKVDEARSRIEELEVEVSKPDLWDDQDRARKVNTELSQLQEDVTLVDQLDGTVSDLETLADSTLFAGRNLRQWQLGDGVRLDVFADEARDLDADPGLIAAHEALVKEALALFGGRHFDHYDMLLALSDSGHPSYDVDHAAALAGIGVPAFACTPDLFPDLMAAAIERRDLTQWAAANDLVTTHEPG